MRAQHRVSKLLLRQGIVYYVCQAWTGTHLVWLREQHFDPTGLQLALDAERVNWQSGALSPSVGAQASADPLLGSW